MTFKTEQQIIELLKKTQIPSLRRVRKLYQALDKECKAKLT